MVAVSFARCNQPSDLFVGNILDMALAPADGVHLALVRIDPNDIKSGFAEYHRQGQANISQAKDGDACRLVFNLI